MPDLRLDFSFLSIKTSYNGCWEAKSFISTQARQYSFETLCTDAPDFDALNLIKIFIVETAS